MKTWKIAAISLLSLSFATLAPAAFAQESLVEMVKTAHRAAAPAPC